MSRRASRRAILGTSGAALLLVAAAEAGQAKAAELDGALLAAYRQWLLFDRERIVVEAMSGDEPDFQARFDAYSGPWHDLMRQIMELPARTPEGLQAKAEVLRSLLHNHVGCDDPAGCVASSSEAFAWSLVNDMLGRVG